MIVYNKITWYSKKKGENYCENCPRLKFVGDSENTGHKEFLSNNKNKVILNVILPKKRICIDL